MTAETIARRHSANLVPHEDGGLVTRYAMPTALARQLTTALEAFGYEASWAPDHDDKATAWVYVTPRD